jgi:hypothetical protein
MPSAQKRQRCQKAIRCDWKTKALQKPSITAPLDRCTPAIVLKALRPVFLVGNTLFLAPRLGNQAVPEVLPNGTVLPEIDQHRRSAALLIGYELDSGHSLISLQEVLFAHRTVPQRSGQGAGDVVSGLCGADTLVRADGGIA